MCGKSVRRIIDVIANRAGAIPFIGDFEPGYNTPGQPAAIIVQVDNKKNIVRKNWGYDIHEKLVYNARSESWFEKVSFKDNQRCIIPVGGFYEGPQLFVPVQNDDVIYMAGLYKNDKFVVLTQDSVPTKIHQFYHRAPILLDINRTVPAWLNNAALPYLGDKAQLDIHESLYKVA